MNPFRYTFNILYLHNLFGAPLLTINVYPTQIMSVRTDDSNSTTSPPSPTLQEVQQLRSDLDLISQLSASTSPIFDELSTLRAELSDTKSRLLQANFLIRQLSLSTIPTPSTPIPSASAIRYSSSINPIRYYSTIQIVYELYFYIL